MSLFHIQTPDCIPEHSVHNKIYRERSVQKSRCFVNILYVLICLPNNLYRIYRNWNCTCFVNWQALWGFSPSFERKVSNKQKIWNECSAMLHALKSENKSFIQIVPWLPIGNSTPDKVNIKRSAVWQNPSGKLADFKNYKESSKWDSCLPSQQRWSSSRLLSTRNLTWCSTKLSTSHRLTKRGNTALHQLC